MKYCLGTVQFGLNYGIQGNGQPQKKNVYEMLTFAVDHGIDVFDTASAYGEAEDVLGGYFRTFPEMAGKVEVVSKLRPDAFQGAPCSEWAEITVQNAKDSLRRLGIGKFGAYLFHNAAYIFEPQAVDALNAVREKGLTKRIGVSVYSPDEAMKALEYPVIGAIQIPYNLFDHRLDKCGFFEKAQSQNVLIFSRSSLLQGLIVMDPDHLPDKVSFASEYLKKYMEICSEYGFSALEAAVGYVGKKKGIDYVVFGVDNMAQLEEYISISDKRIPDDMINAIEKAFDVVEERLVNPVLWR